MDPTARAALRPTAGGVRTGRPARAAATALSLALATGCGGESHPPAASAAARGFTRPANARLSPARSRSRRLLGRSVQGRPIWLDELGDPRASRRILVVGCIHGNERAGITVARALIHEVVAPGARLAVVENLNPDGGARSTRQNARGVDLNRNFPFRWHASGRPGDQQYPGPAPLSEPESRVAHGLIVRMRPTISIWFHQPLAVVDESGGDPAIERRFARVSGLPLARLARYPGSAVGWQDHALRGTTAFVVELPPGPLGARRRARVVRAVLTLAQGG